MTSKPCAAVHSLHHFTFSVPDIEEALRFYDVFGLEARMEGDKLSLRTLGHPHVWGTVRQLGDRKQLLYVVYGIHEQDLTAFRQRIDGLRIACEPHPLSDGQGLWFKDPDGIATALVVAPKVSPSAKSPPAIRIETLPGKGAAPARSQVARVRPRYLSHILRFTPDVPRMVEFCERVLGLKLSDRSADVIAFVHTPHGSDHHLVAFAKSHAAGLHHSSWDVGSIDDVGAGAEQMRAAGWGQGWGLGRHVLGSNYFHYVRDPWGSFCEYSFDIDFIPQGFDWLAADHAPADSLYVWGPNLPEDFIQNHEQPAA